MSAFAAQTAMASDGCGVQADLALREFYGLPDEADTNVCRYYGVLLMKSMLTDAGPFASKVQRSIYEHKARHTSKRAVRKCAKKRRTLLRECKNGNKLSAY